MLQSALVGLPPKGYKGETVGNTALSDALMFLRCYRSDVVPRLSYASVEDVFLALAKASHMVNAVENWRRIVGDAVEGFKVSIKRPVPGISGLGHTKGTGTSAI